MKKGTVYLVGAGPGDPGLLTLKAKRLISCADLIIYDYLANPAHLKHAKESAVKIGVGKGFRHKKPSQEKINRWIIRAANEGKSVVRLKGGDPYLFGRGGEEALFLQEHNIPFQVVPGVTSAVACAAYAGIPLTHREHNASVTFLTGHRANDDGLDSISWKRIAGLGGSLVVYMGFYNLGIIARKLIQAGLSSETKVSVIQWGTLPRQRSCDGTLGTIEEEVAKLKLGAPCIIVIGEVVSLRKKLDWFEKLPLFGKKIIVTRMRDKAGFLSSELESRGAEVLEFPTIEIKPLSDFKKLDAAVRRAGEFDWIIFTSPYGVRAFFERMGKTTSKDSRALFGVKIASVGPGTGKMLARFGVRADLEPEQYHAERIADEFQKRRIALNGKKILLIRTDIAPQALDKRLLKMGAQISRVDGYKTRRVTNIEKNVKDVLMGGGADYAAFTSSSTFENFVKILGVSRVRKISKKTKFLSIGPVTSSTIRSLGFKAYKTSRQHSIDGFVAMMEKLK